VNLLILIGSGMGPETLDPALSTVCTIDFALLIDELNVESPQTHPNPFPGHLFTPWSAPSRDAN